MENQITIIEQDARSLEFLKSAIQTTARIGTNQGFKALAKSHPASAMEAATALRDSILQTIVPFLAGDPSAHVSTEVKRILASSLLAKVPPMIRDAISAASGILDAMLPLPNAQSLLTPNQVDYISAFVAGVGLGCDDFIPDDDGQIRVSREVESRWMA